MPSEPDNKMDDLLKAYAKKRRDEAGALLEMHPVTRRLLQAEAAKLRPETRARPESWSSVFWAYWPRFAFGASTIVLLLGATIWVLWQPSDKAGQAMLVAKQDADADRLSARLGTDAERETLARGERQVELKAVVETAAASERLAAEPATRQKTAELVKTEAASDVTRDLRLRRPSEAAPVTLPPAAPAPVRLAKADGPAPDSTPAARAEESKYQLGLAFDSKDKSGSSSAIGNTAAGKNVSLADEVRQKQESLTVAGDGLRLNRQSPALFYSDNSAIANFGNDGLRSYDSLSLLPGGVAPPVDARTQNAFSLTTNSLANNSLLGQGLRFEAGGYGVANEGLPADPYAGKAQGVALSAAKPPAPNLKENDAGASRADSFEKKPANLEQNIALNQNEARFYRTAAANTGQPGEVTARNRFTQARQTPAPTGAAKRTANPAETVLADFEVQQSGERLRVVDADGSVYDGQVLADDRAAGDKLRAVTDQAANQAGRKLAEPRPTDAGARANQAAGNESAAWNFRVSGTNRTLRQPVVLQGVLFAEEEVGQSAGGALNQAPGAAPRSAPTQARPTSQLQNSAQSNLGRQSNMLNQSGQTANLLNVRRIQGQVRIGGANETTLEAVRAEK